MATSGSGTMAVDEGVEQSKHKVPQLQRHIIIHGLRFCRACPQVVADECGWESFGTAGDPYDFDRKLGNCQSMLACVTTGREDCVAGCLQAF